jgi:hypothetical protein
MLLEEIIEAQAQRINGLAERVIALEAERLVPQARPPRENWITARRHNATLICRERQRRQRRGRHPYPASGGCVSPKPFRC